MSRIPLVKRKLDLVTTELSVALLGSPVGLVVATQVATPVIRRTSTSSSALADVSRQLRDAASQASGEDADAASPARRRA